MALNKLKQSFRILLKEKRITLMNITGLSVSLACALFMLLWVQHELSYDRFHTDFDRLYRVETELEDLHWQRIGLTRWLTMYARHLASAEDREALVRLLDDLYEDAELFYFEAWLPAGRVAELREYTQQRGLVLLFVALLLLGAGALRRSTDHARPA